MEIVIPTDCGNAPRKLVITDFITAWALADTETLNSWLAKDAEWLTPTAPADSTQPPQHNAMKLEFLTLATHGREAACNGYLENADTRLDFAHFFHFATTARTSKITLIRSYLIES